MARQTSIDSLAKDLCTSTCLSRSCDNIDELKKESHALDHSNQGLAGWWLGVSKDGKDPSGHIIEISADHGRYLARSYSPWQLATNGKGIPLFEIYGMGEGEDKTQVIYLNHKAAAKKGMDLEPVVKEPSSTVFPMTLSPGTDRDKAVQKLANLISSNPINGTSPAMKMLCSVLKIDPNILIKAATDSGSGDLDGKAIFGIEFAVGKFKKKIKKYKKTELNKKKKNTGKLESLSCRVPAVLERNGCFSFCVTVEDKDQQCGENILEGYRAIDHVILDIADSMGKGKHKKDEDLDEFCPLLCRQALDQALNQQPVLSGSTTFNKINVTASLDPLTGLYTSSNGYLVTEVIYFTRKFGKWQENGEIQEPSETEPYDYVEAVKLTGDPDVPAGQVAFRAKVGEKYKLPPGPVLKKEMGAVACYLGRGRLTGFQESRWVDVEVHILGEKYRKDGFPVGLLYSASKYQVLKLLKQLSLPGIQKAD